MKSHQERTHLEKQGFSLVTTITIKVSPDLELQALK